MAGKRVLPTLGLTLTLLGVCLPKSGSGYETLSREKALPMVEKVVASMRDNMNEPGKLEDLLDWYQSILDHPKVQAQFREILERSQEPGSVLAVLEARPYGLNPPKEPQAAKAVGVTFIKGFLTHRSINVRKRAAELLVKDFRERKLAYPVYLSLAAMKDWEPRVQEELSSLIKQGGDGRGAYSEFNLACAKASFAWEVIEPLIQYPTPEARRVARQALLEHGMLASLERVALTDPKTLGEEDADHFDKDTRKAYRIMLKDFKRFLTKMEKGK